MRHVREVGGAAAQQPVVAWSACRAWYGLPTRAYRGWCESHDEEGLIITTRGKMDLDCARPCGLRGPTPRCSALSASGTGCPADSVNCSSRDIRHAAPRWSKRFLANPTVQQLISSGVALIPEMLASGATVVGLARRSASRCQQIRQPFQAMKSPPYPEGRQRDATIMKALEYDHRRCQGCRPGERNRPLWRSARRRHRRGRHRQRSAGAASQCAAGAGLLGSRHEASRRW